MRDSGDSGPESQDQKCLSKLSKMRFIKQFVKEIQKSHTNIKI